MIKTFKWLVLATKCEIYLFTKEKKKKKYDWWHLETFHIIESFQIETKTEIHVWNLFVSVF